MRIEKSIIRQLSSHTYFNCEKLFIRGSYAFNLQNQYSDLDILIVSDDFIDLDIVTRKRILHKSLGEDVEIKVDAICLSQKEYYYIIGTNRINYLCMPFKSGQEIKKKVTEDVIYQVYRPFANFGNKAVVVFVSPCEGTEPFYNAIKRATANLNWTIHTLMGDNLMKLLKYNSVI